MCFFRAGLAGVDLFVRLTPRGGADSIDGVETTADGKVHLKARVRALPEKGAANAALETLFAKALRVPKGDVRVVAGATARLKTLHINGDPAEMTRRLQEIAGFNP